MIADAQYSVLTPTAAELSKYGDIPMNYYTGRANVTIPLYSTTQRNVTLDVNMTFDTGAINMNTLPSWTGHGWTLNAGGLISRITMGKPDEADTTYVREENAQYPILHFHEDYFHNCNTLPSATQDPYATINEIAHNLTGDASPDVFYFNFMGRTGHFIFGNDGCWKLFSNENLDIVFDIDDTRNYCSPPYTYPNGHHHPKSIRGFTIADEDGTRYIFGGDMSSIEYSTDLFNCPEYNDESGEADTRMLTPWVSSSWYLTRVEDRFGNTLYQFSYSRGHLFAHLTRSDVSTSRRDGMEFHYNGTLMSPVYLDSIVTLDGQRIEFGSETDRTLTSSLLYSSFYANHQFRDVFSTEENNRIKYPCSYLVDEGVQQGSIPDAFLEYYRNDPLRLMSLRHLSSIRVFPDHNLSDTSVRYDFTYGYNFRMHITGIRIDNGISGNYAMQYNDTNLPYPDYLTEDIDSCGYYSTCLDEDDSGEDDSGSLPPVPPVPKNDGTDAGLLPGFPGLPNEGEETDPSSQPEIICHSEAIRYRHASEEHTKCGLLTRITYPTGGYTEFGYEQNRIISDRLSYGARIRSITDYDSPGHIARNRTYTYQTGIQASSLIGNNSFMLSDALFQNTGIGPDAILTPLSQQPLSGLIIPMSSSFGPNVGYGGVTEHWDDGSTVHYRYFHQKNYLAPKNNSPYDVLTAGHLCNGKLLSHSVFSPDSTISRHVAYFYKTSSLNSCHTSAILYKTLYDTFWTYLIPFITDVNAWYELYNPKCDIAYEVTTETDSEGNILTDTISYDKHDYVLTIDEPYQHQAVIRKCLSKTMSRRGSSLQTRETYTYPCMYVPGTSQSQGTRPSTPVTFNDADRMSDMSRLYKRQFYLPILSTTRHYNSSYVEKDSTVYGERGGFIAPMYELRYTRAAVPDTIIKYRTYMPDGLPHTYSEFGKPFTRLFWNTHGHLAAKVTSPYSPDSFVYSEVVSDSCENYSTVTLNGVDVFSVPLTEAETYTYNRYNLINSIRSSNGRSRYYLYDNALRLRQVRDENYDIVTQFRYGYANGRYTNEDLLPNGFELTEQ